MNYNPLEMMAVAAAREIRDYEVVFVGVGIPLMAGLIASKTHAANATLVYEGGGVGGASRRNIWTISDNSTTDNAYAINDMWLMFSDTQRGFIDKGMIGGAQVDKYGNLNTTVILGEGGTYQSPKVRLPGSGGANDIASSCGETIIVMKLAKGKCVNRIDYITSPGHLDGPGARKRVGLKGRGPSALISDKGVFRFDKDTKEMYLDTIFPGIPVEEVKSYFEWDLKVRSDLQLMQLPYPEELAVIQTYDPRGIILGTQKEEKEQTFEEYYRTMKAGYESVVLNLSD
jgi:glutaconate CoA-transferase subunit B